MSNLLLRIITSIILLPIVIYAFWVGGIFLLALLALVSLFCSLEIANIIGSQDIFYKAMALIFCAGLFVAMLLSSHNIQAASLLFLVFLISNIIILFSPKINREKLEKLTAIFYFILYVIIAMSCLFWLSLHNISLIFLACAATWGNDSCAYFGGRLFGRHPLFKSVSAKKTWEGFVAGALGSLLIIYLLNYIIPKSAWHPFYDLTLSDFLWIALPTIILAPLGDLIESKLKRIYDTKDASNILPGHGGLLDRIDALLLVIPWTASYAFFIRPL